MKKWTINEKNGRDSLDIYALNGLVFFEFSGTRNVDIHAELKYLVETRETITRNDLCEYFDQNFVVAQSSFLKTFSEIVEELRKEGG